MAVRFLASLPLDDFAPPLQSNFARHRYAHAFGDADDFKVEGIERIEGIAPTSRREQSGEEPVLVAVSHQVFAIFESRQHEARALQAQGSELIVRMRVPPLAHDI